MTAPLSHIDKEENFMGTQVTSNGVQSDKVEHWSGDEVGFTYTPRVDAFPSVEDATEALLEQFGGDRDKFLADLLNQYNSNVRYAARREAVQSYGKTLGIEEGHEPLFKSLVTAIRARLDAVKEDAGNLKIAKRKALAKLQAIAAIADAD